MDIRYHGTYVDGLSFSNEVILDNAITSNYSLTYVPTDDTDFSYSIRIDLSRTSFTFRDNKSSMNIRYTSKDGITYTMTSYNPGEIGYRFYIPLDVNENILKFINTNTGNLTGIYKYSSRASAAVKPYDLISTSMPLTPSTLSNIVKGSSVDVSFVSDIIDKLKTLSGINTFNRILLTMNEAMTKVHFVMYYPSGSTSLGSPSSIYCTNNKYYYVTTNTNTTSTYISGMHYFEYDISTKALTELTFTQDITFTTNADNSQYYAGKEITDKYYLGAYRYNTTYMQCYLTSSSMTYYADNTVNSKSTWSSSIWYSTLYKYGSAPSQLTLNNTNLLYPDITAYGTDNVITGDGSIYNNLDFTYICQNMLNLQATNNINTATIFNQNNKMLVNMVSSTHTNIRNKITYLKKVLSKPNTDNYVCMTSVDNNKIAPYTLTNTNNVIFSSDGSHYFYDFVIYNTSDDSVYYTINRTSGVSYITYTYNTKILYMFKGTNNTYDVYLYDLDTLTDTKIISNLGLSSDCTVKTYMMNIYERNYFTLLYVVKNPNEDSGRRRYFYSYYYDIETKTLYSANTLTRMPMDYGDYAYSGYITYDKNNIYTIGFYYSGRTTNAFNFATKRASYLTDESSTNAYEYAGSIKPITTIPSSNNGVYTLGGTNTISVDYPRCNSSYKDVTFTIDKSNFPEYETTTMDLNPSSLEYPYTPNTLGLIGTNVGLFSFMVIPNSETNITIKLIELFNSGTQSVVVKDANHECKHSISVLYYTPIEDTESVGYTWQGVVSPLEYYTISDCTDYDTVMVNNKNCITLWNKPQSEE